MIRRLFWFFLGALCALFGASWFKKKSAEIGEKMSPENLARSLVEHAVALSKKIAEVSVSAWKSTRGGADATDPGSSAGTGG